MKDYIALGDGISIDYAGKGAAARLHRALVARHPGIHFADLTADSATTDDILRAQLPRVDPDDAPTIVTITAGAHDILPHLDAARPPVRLVAGINERLTRIVEETLARRPQAIVLVGTVDETRFDRETEWVHGINEHLLALSEAHPNVRVIDLRTAAGPDDVARLWMEALD